MLLRFFPKFRLVLGDFNLKQIGYLLSALICIGGVGCSHKVQPTISFSELEAHLQPLTAIGAYAGFDPKTQVLYMGNRLIEREIHISQNRIQTRRYTDKRSGQSCVDLPSQEFQFRIGEMVFAGDGQRLTYDTYRISPERGGGKTITIQLTYAPADVEKPIFHLGVHYEISPDLPVIRKWLTIQNLTDSAFFLEDITVESLAFFATRTDGLQIWGCQFSESPEDLHSPPWEGGATNPFIAVQDIDTGEGVVLGNAYPGFLKYYRVYAGGNTVSIGLTPTTNINGTEIRVPPEQSVNTSQAWTMPFQGAVGEGVKNAMRDIRSHLTNGKPQHPTIRWTALPSAQSPPKASLQDADFTAVDYDWNIGDLDGLKQISRQIHESGGKFGIRLPLAEIRTSVLDRPAWQLTPVPVFKPDADAKEGEPQGLEAEKREAPVTEKGEESAESSQAQRVTYCVLSSYGYYLTQAVKTLLDETEADLLIFDRPIFVSQNSVIKGCNAFGHEHYSRAESIGLIYQWVFEFADHLHQTYPNLKLGITATAYGVDKPDTACLEHFDFFFDPSFGT